jgi:hypothetical protein
MEIAPQRSKVRFNSDLTVVIFRVSDPPPLGSLGQLRPSLRPIPLRPHAETLSFMYSSACGHEKGHGQSEMRDHGESSSRPSWKFSDNFRARTAQEEQMQPQCQVVRRRGWWRKGKRDDGAQLPTRSSVEQQIFRDKLHECCFNCLARDHQVYRC